MLKRSQGQHQSHFQPSTKLRLVSLWPWDSIGKNAWPHWEHRLGTQTSQSIIYWMAFPQTLDSQGLRMLRRFWELWLQALNSPPSRKWFEVTRIRWHQHSSKFQLHHQPYIAYTSNNADDRRKSRHFSKGDYRIVRRRLRRWGWWRWGTGWGRRRLGARGQHCDHSGRRRSNQKSNKLINLAYGSRVLANWCSSGLFRMRQELITCCQSVIRSNGKRRLGPRRTRRQPGWKPRPWSWRWRRW